MFDNAPLRALGAVSYGIYIYHLPIQNLIARLMPRVSMNAVDHWAWFGAGSLAVSMAVAAVSYRMLERPVARAVRLGMTKWHHVGA